MRKNKQKKSHPQEESKTSQQDQILEIKLEEKS
jgi:hypothetical protein